MSRPARSPRRSPRESRRRRDNEDQSPSRGNADGSSSPVQASPSSWNVDRGRSRVRRPSNAFSEENLRRRGYNTIISSFNKVFHLERRWKLVRELGSGAYGVVISAADEISGETVAIKLVTRVFEKIQFAKRALREITLLRHFSHHSNITGLIDVDAISPDFSEMYIIRSGQSLTNEHVQYFTYQILRGMKYIHSAGVIHRDLKPGNLLVNADCELKICDFGLARGFDSTPDENAAHLTEYVATRWYRAPEIMLAYRKYNTAIDIWSIGCILGELLLGAPLFKGKDYGTPDSNVIRKIGSPKAQAYVRSLPIKKVVPFIKLMPKADEQALELLEKMLCFDPAVRVNVGQALEHPWLSAYHDPIDEPDCPVKFDQWRQIETLETMDEFREAIWKEIEDYRREVRGLGIELSALSAQPPLSTSPAPMSVSHSPESLRESTASASPAVSFRKNIFPPKEDDLQSTEPMDNAKHPLSYQDDSEPPTEATRKEAEDTLPDTLPSLSPGVHRRSVTTPTDPVTNYGITRRSSILQPSLQGSTYNSPLVSNYVPTFVDGSNISDKLGQGTIPFPTQSYVVPARSRTGSTVGGEATRKLLRTLSTVSIHESGQGLPGGLAGIAPIGKFINQANTDADAPPSEVPKDFGITSPSSGEDKDYEQKKGGRFIVG
ncbi:kinase-like domain-containing protein [Crepidotus variabilis]|uniref:Kinase-like domain-containing protein n=1 Tax=Crepidotus variabilis TaxID=179855 RepID=A0A9P6EK49_9AGAR|nr:kinase-like domain-containing protein [Crepidotus variabilis]